ncbi:MAG: lactate utilization protein [Chloroflexi bacterium]|nr:lactate utilization protein [Chloroflexota bacterium]
MKVTLEALKRRGFDARYAENREAARKTIVELVPEHWIVGIGDSVSIRSLGVIQDLMDLGNRVLNPYALPKILRENPQRLPVRVMKQTSQGCDVFLAAANAVTRDGIIVCTDGGSNRVTGMAFGPMRSIIVAGKNKIVQDIDGAFHRIKNVITPFHCKYIGYPASCVPVGKCVEPETSCDAGHRACNTTLVLEGNPVGVEIQVIVLLVDDDLGLSWDPAWPQERINRIQAEYHQFTPPHVGKH